MFGKSSGLMADLKASSSTMPPPATTTQAEAPIAGAAGDRLSADDLSVESRNVDVAAAAPDLEPTPELSWLLLRRWLKLALRDWALEVVDQTPAGERRTPKDFLRHVQDKCEEGPLLEEDPALRLEERRFNLLLENVECD